MLRVLVVGALQTLWIVRVAMNVTMELAYASLDHGAFDVLVLVHIFPRF